VFQRRHTYMESSATTVFHTVRFSDPHTMRGEWQV
jgi:hypothetical protein